jgi:hypothetical protein
MELYQSFAFDDRPSSPVESIDSTSSEFLGAGIKQTLELNPTNQMLRLGELRSLEPGETFVNEMGMEQTTPGLAADDPRARRMTLEEANELGKTDGLRFSEPPTQGQYDYLRDLKRAENERALTLSKAPGIGTQAVGFLADLAASAVDPINIASAFVPIVGPARTVALTARLGVQGGRLAKGAIEGAAGAALVEPLIYTQAQALQQDFTLSDAFLDVVMGAGLGSGLHWGGGLIADRIKGMRFAGALNAAADDIRFRPQNPDISPYAFDRRSIRTPMGDNPHVVDAMSPTDRASTLNAAVKAVESDRFPAISELLKTDPSMRSLAMQDKRFPATMRLRAEMRSSDLVPGSKVDDIISQHLYSSIKGADSPDPKVAFDSLFKHFAKRYKGMKDWSIWTRPDEMYQREADRGALEFPEQQVYVDADSKTIVASEGASLAAVRHEIERALDLVHGYRDAQAGGYRYRRGDTDGPVVHRQALKALYDADSSRMAAPAARPEQALDIFARQAEPIIKPDNAASEAIWDRVESSKDMDLDTIIRDEEIAVAEDTLRHIGNSTRAAGIIEKVTPIEERDLFDELAVAKAAEGLGAKVEAAVQESVDGDLKDAKLLNDLRSIIDADPELLQKWVRGEITDEELDAQVGKPLPEKTPEPGEEPAGDTGKAEEPLDEDALIADIQTQVEGLLKGLEAADASDIEARLVAKEQQALSGNRAVKDLFDESEKVEFDETNAARASRASKAAPAAGTGTHAGAQPAGTPLENGLDAVAPGRDGAADRRQGPKLDAERSAGGGDRSPSETARSIGYGTVPTRVITPDGSIEVGVEPVIVEFGSLRRAEGKFQPRDRSRKESDANIRERANRLDPEQLMPTRVSDSGPPIVTKDGMVISGNGRFATIGQVYQHITLAEQAQRYRDRLGPAADGYKQPILVMRITDDMSDESLVKFADRSNRGRIESMSATEKAQRDVGAAGIDLMLLYQGGDFESRENRNFLQAFMRRVVTATELGEMSKNGRLTKEGYDRLNASVLAAAYDDTGVLSLMLESADDNIRSITSAYRDAAPGFMKLRAEIAAGVVKEEMDLTPYMMQAARLISEQREKGVKIADFLAQQDAFNPLDPTVEALIRAYYNPQLTRAVSALRIGEFLGYFVDEARLHKEGGFLADETTGQQVIEVALRKAQQERVSDDQDPTGLLGIESSPRPSAPEERPAAPQPAPAEPRQEAGGAGLPTALAALNVTKLKALAKERSIKLKANIRKADLIAELEKWRAANEGGQAPVAEAVAAPQPSPQGGGEPARTKSLIVLAGKGEAEFKALAEGMSEGEITAAMLRARMGVPAGATKRGLVDAAYAQAQAIRKDRDAAAGGDDTTNKMVDTIIRREEKRGLSDEEIDALPDVEEGAKSASEKAPPSTAQFYAYLKGDAPVKDARTIAKALKVSVDEAHKLLDHGVDNGWLKLKDNGIYIRVAKKDRPVLPSFMDETPARSQRVIRELEELSVFPEFRKELDDWLVTERRNTWIYGDGYKIYLRKSMTVNGLLLDIANVSVDTTGQGTFRKMLIEAEEAARLHGLEGIRIENVMTDQFASFFRKAGWQEDRRYFDDDEPPTFFKKFGQESLSDSPSRSILERLIARNEDEINALDANRKSLLEFRNGIEAEQNNLDKKSPHYVNIFTDMAKQIKAINKALGELEDGRMVRVRRREAWKNDIRNLPVDPPVTQAPVGWGNTDIDIANIVRPMNAGELIIHTEAEALTFIKEKFGLGSWAAVRKEWGYINDRDYVGLARSHGFKPDPRYDTFMMERDLQAELAVTRAANEAMRILPPVIRVQVKDAIFHAATRGVNSKIVGMFDPVNAMVTIAKNTGRELETAHHESLHALKSLRLFTKHEWKILAKAAIDEGWLAPDAKERYKRYYRNQAEGLQKEEMLMGEQPRALNDILKEMGARNRLVEEAIANRYGKWAAERKQPSTPAEMLLQRVKDFVKAFTDAFKRFFGQDNVDTIFNAIHRGDIGKRWAEINQGRIDDNAKYSVHSASLDERVRATNAELKKMVSDDSEKLGNLRIRSIEALAPCAAYHA